MGSNGEEGGAQDEHEELCTVRKTALLHCSLPPITPTSTSRTTLIRLFANFVRNSCGRLQYNSLFFHFASDS